MSEDAVFLVVTAGRGPLECRVAVGLVARRIAAEAEAAGFSVAAELPEAGDPTGSVLLAIGGAGAGVFGDGWLGTVQWIDNGLRIGRARKNWYVAVRRVPPPAAAPVLTEAEVRFETMRAGGPGGQHQNTTDSAVRVVHLATGLAALARDGRSQHQNRKRAFDRLAALLAARSERDALGARRKEWLDRITVERGNPTRIYEGQDMRQRD